MNKLPNSEQLGARRKAAFQKSLLGWFRQHQRELPWRVSRDPYRIWVAEVMLQQTRIAAVIPYYERFLARFPTVESLAAARDEEVLKFWAGLGYYSRARNLQSAAKKIVVEHDGRFPRDFAAALTLPGIGRYTAAAVLSIAYNAEFAVLDGNVARVLARLGAIRGDLREPRRWQRLSATADAMLARDAPSDWNQALMELGETICTPQKPRCQECPVSHTCRAHELKLAHRIPAPRKKRAGVAVKIAAAILCDPAGRTLLVRDPGAHDEVLFSRMWQFPAVEVKRNAVRDLAEHLEETLGVEAAALEPLAAARHGVTFRSITLLPFRVEVERLPQRDRTRVVMLKHVREIPVSSGTRKIAGAALQTTMQFAEGRAKQS